jgi:hypothetical protein
MSGDFGQIRHKFRLAVISQSLVAVHYVVPGTWEPRIMNSVKPKAEEERSAPRYPIVRLAKIQLELGDPPRYCVVTEISEGGVRIDTTGFNVPDEFVLILSDDGPARNGT